MATAAVYKLVDFKVCPPHPSYTQQSRVSSPYLPNSYSHGQTFHNVIDNELADTEKVRRAVDPSTGRHLAEVPVSTQADVDRAVASSQAAFPAWRRLSQDERAAYLVRFADAIEANHGGLAPLLGAEAGKPPQAVKVEISLIARQIRGTVRLRLDEETIEDTDEVCARQDG